MTQEELTTTREATARPGSDAGLNSEPPIVTAYPCWGGPWDGDTIDYADHETPDDYLGPDDIPIVNGKLDGLYVLKDAENGYVWVRGPWPVASDNLPLHKSA